jgi:hypothetical protein
VTALRRALLVGIVAFGVVVAWSGTAAADNCSSPGDCEETGGYNGIIAVVGGAAAVAAAAAAAIASTPEGEETDLAIVQVSVDTLDIAVDEPGELTLTGWHVGADGNLERVGMALWVEVPPASGVRVTPTEGSGELTVSVEVDEETMPEEPAPVELQAKGSWDGKEAGATVIVNLGGDYELRLY